MADRYKGLTVAQRKRMLLALREDTLVRAGGGFPARQSEITTPSDGDVVKIWYDASYGGAFMNAEGDSPVYRASPGGVEFDSSNNEHMECVGALNSPNVDYFDLFNEGDFTFAAQFQAKNFPNSSGNYEEFTIFTNWLSSTKNSIKVAIESQGGTTPGDTTSTDQITINVYMWDGNNQTRVWSTGESSSEIISLASTGHDEIWVSQDTSGTNQVDVAWNGTVVYSASGFSLPASTDTDLPLIGNDAGGNAGPFNGPIRAIAIDTEPGRGPALIDWCKGNDYTP